MSTGNPPAEDSEKISRNLDIPQPVAIKRLLRMLSAVWKRTVRSEVFDPADINGYTYGHNCREGKSMKFVSVAEAKNRLTVYLAQARKKKEPIIVTHHGKPYALIQPISEEDLEGLGWDQLAQSRLRKVWEGEDDALYNYL